MNRCFVCGEEFENKYRFCPVDGQSLIVVSDYRLTLIDEQALTARLVTEFRFAIGQVRHAWPSFKAAPIAFIRVRLHQWLRAVKRTLARPYALPGALTAAAVLIGLVLSVALFDRKSGSGEQVEDAGENSLVVAINLAEPAKDSNPGVAAGGQGRVGISRGRGEGSGPTAKKSQGGGGGGDLSKAPPSQGRPPQPSEIPAPIPTTYARALPQALPAAGIDIDPVLYSRLPFPTYGDPRSKQTTPSNGPGTGGGVGTASGAGIGEGDGNGFGPGRKGNMGGDENSHGCCGEGGSTGGNPRGDFDRVFKTSELTTRARVLYKPEPQYTDDARQKQITGTVVLSVVFSREGNVTNIRAVQTLCCGLTERAIAAAKQIRFLPATRDGHAVGTYMQLQYNFNLY